MRVFEIGGGDLINPRLTIVTVWNTVVLEVARLEVTELKTEAQWS